MDNGIRSRDLIFRNHFRDSYSLLDISIVVTRRGHAEKVTRQHKVETSGHFCAWLKRKFTITPQSRNS